MLAKVLTFLIFVLGIKTNFAQSTPTANKLYLQFLCSVNEVALKNKKVTESVLIGATIRVVDSENKQIFSGNYDGKKRTIIKLPLNQNFTVYVSKDGYVSKHFLVNTIVPKQKTAIYMFSLDVSLFKKVPDLDIQLTEPIAIVQFFSKEVKFDYDFEYTEEINAALKEKYCDYYLILGERELEQELQKDKAEN